jgi:hypothetical protein
MKMKISAVKPSEFKLYRGAKPTKVDGRVVITWSDFDFSGLDTNITSEKEMKKLMSDLRKAALKAGWSDL